MNGIRSRYLEVAAFAAQHRPDVLCLQEIKASRAQVPEPLTTLSEYWSLWHGQAGGYSGVSLHLLRRSFPRAPSFAHPHFDVETRMVEVELDDRVVASVYVPNGGKDYPAKLQFLAALADHVQAQHERGRRVIVCGDLNVAREARDVHPSQRSEKQIGQRPDERALFERLFERGLVDLARELHPEDPRLFTWWPPWRDLRAKNEGWRIDYVLASAALAARATSSRVYREFGSSDHGPLEVTFDGV